MPLTTSHRFGLLYRHIPVLLLIILMCALSACSGPTEQPVQEGVIFVTANSATQAGATSTSTPARTTTPVPTEETAGMVNTQDPDPTPLPQDMDPITPFPTPDGPCTYNADYVEDINLADGFSVQPATLVRKGWRLRNNGTCPWPAGTRLVVVQGDALNILAQANLPQTATGEVGDVYLDFISQGYHGEFTSYLRMQPPEGQGTVFGSVIFLDFMVSGAATPLPYIAPPVAQATPQSNTETKTDPALPGPATRTLAPTPTPVPNVDKTLAPTLTATPPGTNTPTTAPSPEPTMSPTPTPSSNQDDSKDEQALPGAQAVANCAYPRDPRFDNVMSKLSILNIDMGCPTSQTYTASGSIQAFTSNANMVFTTNRDFSLMVLRDDWSVIYIIRGQDEHGVTNGQLSIALDPWHPTLSLIPEACQGMESPSGYVIPERGFGYLWCQQKLYDTLGWPKTPTEAATLTIQETENGLLIQAQTHVTRQIYTMALTMTPGIKQATIVVGY